MKIRTVVYLLVFAFMAYFLYNYNQVEAIVAPPSITQQQIFSDFADLTDNDIPAASLGGQFFTTEIFFPDDFVGDAGNEFYVSMEDGHVLYTQRYIIQEIDAQQGKAGKLVYKLKANWENFRPPAGKYESYKFDGEKWKKVSN